MRDTTSNFALIVAELKEKLNVDEKYLFKHSSFILKNCVSAFSNSKTLSSSTFVSELTQYKETPSKFYASQTTPKQSESLPPNDVAQVTPGTPPRTDKKTILIDPLEIKTSEKRKIPTTQQPAPAKKKKESPPSMPELVNFDAFLRKEEEDGNLSDSGDRNPIRIPQTFCNYCKKHRHELMVCKSCGEYQLCSVCFYKLNLDSYIPEKYSDKKHNAFEVCGMKQMFICRPCKEDIEENGESSDDYSDTSINLDGESSDDGTSHLEQTKKEKAIRKKQKIASQRTKPTKPTKAQKQK